MGFSSSLSMMGYASCGFLHDNKSLLPRKPSSMGGGRLRWWPKRGSREGPNLVDSSMPFKLKSPLGRRLVVSSLEPKEESSGRTSPNEVRKEIQMCYELVHKLGRGVVYLGSSRVKSDHSHYRQAAELAREIANLLDCTTWTGAGPGFMDAAVKGALDAKKPVGGFKIAKESGEWTTSNFHPYLSSEMYLTCRFFSARKHGLVDAAMRNDPSDRTAVVAFPGGIGTLDELLDFMDDCENWGTVARGEVASLWKVCNGNLEALEYLAEFYNIPRSRRDYDIKLVLSRE